MTTIQDIRAALEAPFPLSAVEIKPGATTQGKSKGLALAYVDVRAYQQRLDEVAGADNWTVAFRPWGDRRIIAAVTIYGITKESTGEGEANDVNCGTSAEAQAFKRACSAFGLGRYLYELPQVWAPYDAQKKQFVDAPGIVQRIYTQAGLRDPARQPAPAPPAPPAPNGKPRDAAEAERRFFARYSEVVGGEDWAAVQQYLGIGRSQPATIEGWIVAAQAVRDWVPAQ